MVAVAQQIVVDLYPTQDDFVHDERRYPCFIGGRNSGKTYAGSWKAMRKAREGGLGCIAAPSFPMLEHGAKMQFLARLNEIRVLYRPTRSGIAIPPWNAEVVFVTLESESRVRGPNYSWAWPDEIEYVSDREIWKALKGAVREGDNPQIFPTSTPKGRGLIYDEWIIAADESHPVYKATTFDNPFIDAADYVAGLNYSGVFYDQEIRAEFVAFEGLVYPAFSRAGSVLHQDVTGWATVLGLDVGTRNPTALIVCRYGGDRLHIEREHYQRGMSSDDITDLAVAVWEQYQPEYLVIDPSAAGLILTLQQRGIRVRKAINDVLIGISTVTSTLPHLTVDPSCVNTIAEFESYRYPDGRRGNTDSPVKENDHALDALRYVCMELYGKPASDWGIM
jgi:phage terminase large subunit